MRGKSVWRLIGRSLDGAEQAFRDHDRDYLGERARDVPLLDPENQEAHELLVAADRATGVAADSDRRVCTRLVERRAPMLCAAAAFATAWVALIPILSMVGWRTSGLVHMTEGEPMAQLARASDPDFAFVPTGAHYDGVYYYAMAMDPFARGTAHRLIDQAAYRYGHPAYGWLAGLASLGQARVLPQVMLALNLAATAFAAYLVSLLAREIDRSPWWGMLVALNAGFIYAVTNDTTEPTLMAVTALGVLLWLQRHRAAFVPLAAGCFVKEVGLLVPVGLALYELAELLRRGRFPAAATRGPWLRRTAVLAAAARGSRLRRLAALAVGPIFYGYWSVYVRAHFGAWSTSDQGNLAFPLTGIADTLRRAAGLGLGSFDQMQIGTAMVPIIAVCSGAFVFGLVRSVRLRTPFQAILVPMAILMLSLNWWPLLYPKDLIRTAVVPLTFLALALLARPPGDAGMEDAGVTAGRRWLTKLLNAKVAEYLEKHSTPSYERDRN